MKSKTFRMIAILLVVFSLAVMLIAVLPVQAAANAVSPPVGVATMLLAIPADQPAKAVSVALTPEMLVAFAAMFLAILFDWLPGLKNWYDKYSDGQKRGLMAGCLVLITGAVFGLSCAGWLTTGWLCNGQGVQDAVFLLILAIAINQGFHSLTKP
jgi:hypothetical protein